MPRSPTARHVLAAALAAVLLWPAGDAAAQRRATDGTITRVAGSFPGLGGDGGPATAAQLSAPADVAVMPDGSLAIADTGNDRIRLVFPDGRIDTIAGTTRGLSGDGGPADEAQLDRPTSVAVAADGSLLVSDTFNQRIRRITPDGTITSVVGAHTPRGVPGFGGDGGPAEAARVDHPGGLAALPGGGYLIADTGNHRIRRVGPDGMITTIAGTVAGFSGDGGPATAARLNRPTDVAVADDGSILVADTGNQRVRRIEPDGTIVTVAGQSAGFSGDRAPARFAQLANPSAVLPLTNGGVLVSDTSNHRVRRVTPLGTIFTVAGAGAGNSGDGRLARDARLNQPGGLAHAPGGGFYVVDSLNATVRRVSDIGAIPPAQLARSFNVAPASGTVRLRPPGTPDFLPVREEDLVPMRSEVDATRGRIELRTARDGAGAQQVANAFDGLFVLRQANAAQAFSTLRLPSLSGCSAPRSRAGAAPRARMALQGSKRKRKRQRRRKRRGPSRALWVRDNGGRWRSATGSVSAAAVGTLWKTTLTCDGVRVTVREGRVRVRDTLRRRTRVLRPGQTIFIRTPGRHRGR
jgi:hypothetical protein